MKNKFAFTLAEVLITLGIIGIISALTLPTLLQNYQDKVTVVKLKETYSIFNQAFKMAVLENGSPENWEFADLKSTTVTNPDGSEFRDYNNESNTLSSGILFNIFSPYLKIVKKYGPNDGILFGKSQSSIKLYSGILMNGVAFAMYPESSDCHKSWGSTSIALQNVCAILHVNINGRNYRHVNKSKFGFFITKYGIIPFGESPEVVDCLKQKSEWCTGWVLQNENLDYLYCKDLSWNGKTKCK